MFICRQKTKRKYRTYPNVKIPKAGYYHSNNFQQYSRTISTRAELNNTHIPFISNEHIPNIPYISSEQITTTPYISSEHTIAELQDPHLSPHKKHELSEQAEDAHSLITTLRQTLRRSVVWTRLRRELHRKGIKPRLGILPLQNKV